MQKTVKRKVENEHGVKHTLNGDVSYKRTDGTLLNRAARREEAQQVRVVMANSHKTFYINSLRTIFNIPVNVAHVLQENILPKILLTEGYSVFNKNFGLSRDKMWNNLLLGGIVACTLSNFWINPWLDGEEESVTAIWHQATNTSIPDYYPKFYSSLGRFALSLCAHVCAEVLEHIFGFLLSTAITFKSQHEFVLRWLSNFSAYGLNAHNFSSGSESDVEKANLNPVKLFMDIENQELLVSLWSSRINTIINCSTALYALYTMSPTVAINFYLFSIIVPKFIALSFAYSMSLNVILMLFERPMHYFYEKMNHFKDRLIRQITNVDTHAELISFLGGEEFEAKKLLQLLEIERKNALKYDFLNAIRMSIEVYQKHFEWVVPIVASIEAVRNGTMKQEIVGPLMNNYVRVNMFLMWAKQNFQKLEKVEVSAQRLKLYEERLKAWQVEREEIDTKIIDSKKISFSGSIYTDKAKNTLLAKGDFVLPAGSITHIDAPSGSGKTTLIRIFCGLWNDFDGICFLPKTQSIFIPSQPYILGPDEPLFQTVCYPKKFEEGNNAVDKDVEEHIKFVKTLFEALELPERIYDNLIKIPMSANEDVKTINVANWMTSLSDGERKRIAFVNALLKLKTHSIKYLVMDEPFKGIGYTVQIKMVELFRELIKKDSLSAGCTILYSNHEQNHGLNTHVLRTEKVSKKFNLEKVSTNKEINVNKKKLPSKTPINGKARKRF